MSRRLKHPMPEAVSAAQRRASDPRRSVWVRANAGSGKTHVLAERVLRLLLDGARPEEILCLTYTKAAAAEMRARVGKRLAAWALLPAEKLAAELASLDGAPPDNATMMRARTLFAHALETPGGLKINTIHAFCESVLHRFPLEAGIPFDFAVVEEDEGMDMVRRAREQVIAEGIAGVPPIDAAIDLLFGEMSDFSLGEAIESALMDGRKLHRVLADVAGAKRRLRSYLGVPADATVTEVAERIAAGSVLLPGDCRQVAALMGGNPAGTDFADLMARADPLRPTCEQLMVAFFTGEGKRRQRLLRRAEALANPELAERLEREADRLLAARPALTAMRLVARSEALLDVLSAISSRYEAQKRARSLLDFDDLIERVADLFADDGVAGWVKYKLDAGISHVLVDESQDTNPEQWRVITELVDEFLVGDSAAQRPRSYFAVGDEKQSIYSFQGADPSQFGALGRHLARRAAEVGHPHTDLELHFSFRTLAGVLAAVDKVFAPERQRHALLALERGIIHDSVRADSGGTVTLWPPIAEEDVPPPEAWPLDKPHDARSAVQRLAERIAGEIRGWVDSGRALGTRDRPVRPGDVLILVQRRHALFHELVRALARASLPTPGTDRLAVTSHIGVLDLLALGDVLLNPADDLQLAALLRSPLFDVSEDDLFAIAVGRAGSLYAALRESPLPSARDAAARLDAWRGRLDFDRPYEFYAEVLYREGGLKRFHARLGAEIDDVLAEFLALALAHEQTPNPSLQGFLAEMRAREVTIRRELAEAGDGVRVMTVHGAKGLEAPIVILADAASRPAPSTVTPKVFIETERPGPLFVYASGEADHVEGTMAFRTASREAEDREYWRRLYVGMTRAEDELYITGYLGKKPAAGQSWYDAAAEALEPEAETVRDREGDTAALIYPRQRPPASASPPDNRPAPMEPSPTPLVLAPLPPVAPIPTITPSTAGPIRPEAALNRARESLADAEMARRGGLALHALLEHLPAVAPADRPAAAEKALAALLPEAPEQHAALAARALSILAKPEFSLIFGPDSRAEIPFLVDAWRDGRPVRLAGRIDRLLVAKHRVLVLDYKSDAIPPGDVSGVPASYRMQVGLYAHVASQLFPGRVIEAGILWTSLESLMILPAEILREAASAFTMR
jgi:ATP-dependent helicase/nuclease subunit A